jgi:diacylglycerol O-acyltransferase
VDRMSATDAGFYFAEGENTPMHVGSVTVFEGPAPSYGDVVRLLLGKIARVPRYRQRVQTTPLNFARPMWVDDVHFQILYHIRHTAVPRPGNADQLRNLAGRVLGQRMDMTKPLWELWLVEGLENDRWAMINKVHHALVDGVAGTDLMELIFDVDPAATHPDPVDWVPHRPASTASVLVSSAVDAVAHPIRQLGTLTGGAARLPSPKRLLERGLVLGSAAVTTGRQVLSPGALSMNGPIGPHRRWVWAETSWDDVKKIRAAFGGSMNDIVLAAITAGFRDLLTARGQLNERTVVRTMVPVSLRTESQRGALNNQVSAVFVDLPVHEPSATARLAGVRDQMDAHKRVLGAYDPRTTTGALDLVPPAMLAAGTRLLLRTPQIWAQTITTNVPGPRVPLYVLGRRMESLYPYVPIGAGLRTSIGIFSYRDSITFGINADFDAVPDVDVLSTGIARGVAEYVALAERRRQEKEAAARESPPKGRRRNARRVPAATRGPSATVRP